MDCCPASSRFLAILLLAGAVVVTSVSCSNATNSKSETTSSTVKVTTGAKEADKTPKEPEPDRR